MTVSTWEWILETLSTIRHGNKRDLTRCGYNAYVGMALLGEKYGRIGTNIFERDWDVLIVLDACRVDALKAVEVDYDFISNVDSIWSIGSTSFEWMAQTFHKKFRNKINRTAYVSGNPYVDHVFYRREWPPLNRTIPIGPKSYPAVRSDEFYYLDEIRRYGVDEEENAVPSRTVTDRTIDVHRTHQPDHLVAHYMRPHEPYMEGEDPLGHHVIQRLQRGEIDRDRVWDSYLDNLRGVLDELELLLSNIDAEKVVITADHGEAFGEWGFYGHTIACPVPCVKRVPWVVTSASDEETFEPEINPPSRDTVNPDPDAHLKDLGYM